MWRRGESCASYICGEVLAFLCWFYFRNVTMLAVWNVRCVCEPVIPEMRDDADDARKSSGSSARGRAGC